MLTEEKINSNYLAFIKRLESYGCYSDEMFNEMGELIKNAPYSMSEEYGGAYKGGMIDVTLNNLCKIGYQINEMFISNDNPNLRHETLCVNKNMLMRVLLLLNIAKSDMFVDETEQWRIRKGLVYNFNENLKTKMKLGMRTLFLCQKYGIKLEEEEYEAINAVDVEDDASERFRTPLFTMVRAAKMFTMVELRQQWLNVHNVIQENFEK